MGNLTDTNYFNPVSHNSFKLTFKHIAENASINCVQL
jgi:hypothetical protein